MIDHKELYLQNKKSLLDGLYKLFPIQGRKNTLKAVKIWVEDENFVWDDYPKERNVKLRGSTLGVPVYAELILEDSNGKKVDHIKKQKLMDFPVVTNRMSFLISGVEYQLTNQLRMRPGVYTKFNTLGEVQTKFNVQGGRNFDILLNPVSNIFQFRYGNSVHINLYSLLRGMGVSDAKLSREWGKELFNINKSNANVEKDVDKFYRTVLEKDFKGLVGASSDIKTYFATMSLDPMTTSVTLGKSVKKVDPNSLLLSTQKMLNVSKGEALEDDQDALPFKDIYTVPDLIGDIYERNKNYIQRRIAPEIDRKKNIKQMYNLRRVRSPLYKLMITDETGSTTGLGSTPEQINPIEIIEGLRKTTVLGEQGVTNAQTIPLYMRDYHPSFTGVLDPIDSPEGPKIGLVGHFAKGFNPFLKKVRVFNTKTKKEEYVDPKELFNKKVGFGDDLEGK